MAGKTVKRMKGEAVQSKARERHFPEIIVSRSASGYESAAGLKLIALLKRELNLEKADVRKNDNSNGQAAFLKGVLASRGSFVHAISSWPEYFTLELHLTTVPDLVDRAGRKRARSPGSPR